MDFFFNVEIVGAKDIKCNSMLKTSNSSSTLCKIGDEGGITEVGNIMIVCVVEYEYVGKGRRCYCG